MKLLLTFIIVIECIVTVQTSDLYSQIETNTKTSTSNVGIHIAYQESIVRTDNFGYDFENMYYKDNFTNEFRGYSVGLSYNKKLQDNDNLATITVEALFQKLPMYSEDMLGGGFRLNHEPSRPPTFVKNSIPNYIGTINGMYNFNLFNSGFALSTGISLGYVFSKNFILTTVVDSNVIDFVNGSYLTPLEHYSIGKESTFTNKYGPEVNPFRFGLIIGVNYNFTINTTEIEPFFRYNESITNHNTTDLNEDFLHSFQTGIAVRLPF